MTKRGEFLAGAAAFALAPRSAAAHGGATLAAVFDAFPPVREGTWVQYILGAGEPYSKKIGYGSERTSLGATPFIETEIGDAGGTCNPNTIQKAYLRSADYGDLLAPHRVRAFVMKAGTSFIGVAPEPAERLWLLDRDDLYTAHPATLVASRTETIAVARRHIVVRRVELAFANAPRGLRTMTLWLTPHVPCCVAKLRATTATGPPFELHVDVFGDRYTSQIAATLDSVAH
jgi:hypothetical protein